MRMIEDIVFRLIIVIIFATGFGLGVWIICKTDNEYINQLEQNNIEQAEEKEVYRNRCKMLEDLLEGSGLVVDNCECR